MKNDAFEKKKLQKRTQIIFDILSYLLGSVFFFFHLIARKNKFTKKNTNMGLMQHLISNITVTKEIK